MRKMLAWLVLLFCGLSLLLAACAPTVVTPNGEATQQAIFTQAAQTLFAQLTLSAGETAVAQLTQIAQPSATPLVPTSPPLPPTPISHQPSTHKHAGTWSLRLGRIGPECNGG